MITALFIITALIITAMISIVILNNPRSAPKVITVKSPVTYKRTDMYV